MSACKVDLCKKVYKYIMWNFFKLIICCNLFISIIYGYPDSRNPSSEYELEQLIVHLNTPSSVIINTPPPPPSDSKSFVYDSVAKTWTKVKENDPQPWDETLLWNQSNDKWLTMVSR